VSVVSGHIRGQTNTLPLHVEILYNEYNFQAAFAAASLLTFLALVTLVAKTLVERRAGKGRIVPAEEVVAVANTTGSRAEAQV
jgi:sulfate transport system permease protein